MPEAPCTDWPTTIFARDEDHPEDRYAVVNQPPHPLLWWGTPPARKG